MASTNEDLDALLITDEADDGPPDDGPQDAPTTEGLSREEADMLAAFRARKAEDEDEVERFIELEGERFKVATLDDDVLAHVSAIVIMTGDDDGSRMHQLSEVLQSLLEPGEWPRLRKHVLEVLRQSRAEHARAKAEGEDVPEIPRPADILRVVLEGIMEDFQQVASTPKR